MVNELLAAQCVVALTIDDLAMTIETDFVGPLGHIWMVRRALVVLLVPKVCQCAAAALGRLPGMKVIQGLILKEVLLEDMITHPAVFQVDIPTENLFANPVGLLGMHPLPQVTADHHQLNLSRLRAIINAKDPLPAADLTTMKHTESMIGTESQ